MAKAPIGDSGIEIKSRMKMRVHGWWNSSEQAASLRKDNEWGADGTVAVSGRRKPCLPAGGCAAPKHDQQTSQECADVDEETVKYGYKDPSLDLLRRSYFHIWDKNGQHIGCRSFAQHKEECIAADINPLPERTFYRWRTTEENTFKNSEVFDVNLHFLSRPIRHQSQISGFHNQLGADRTYGRDTMVDKEPVLCTKNGRSFAFSPEWYPDLVKMCNAGLNMLGFGPEMVLAFATDIYATKMLIDEKDAPMYTPSQPWAYWFMRNKLGLRLREAYFEKY
jgi:hypothetical protein